MREPDWDRIKNEGSDIKRKLMAAFLCAAAVGSAAVGVGINIHQDQTKEAMNASYASLDADKTTSDIDLPLMP